MNGATWEAKWKFVGVFSLLTLPIHAGWHINWDFHFSKLNWTRTYATINCPDALGHPQRQLIEERVDAFLTNEERRKAMLADVREGGRYIEMEQLHQQCVAGVHDLHRAIVEGYLSDNPRLLSVSDLAFLEKLDTLLQDPEFINGVRIAKKSIFESDVDITRIIQSYRVNLQKVRDHIQPNISKIAQTPKMATLCFLVVGIGLYAWSHYQKEIVHLAQEAEEKAEQGAVIAANATAQAITHALAHKPEEKPEEKHDEHDEKK